MVPRVGGAAAAAAAAATAVALRFVLASWGATSVLEGRVEVGTPANSLPRAREAVFLAANLQLSPYSSSSFHGPPLLAPLLAPFIGDAAHDTPAWQILPFAAADAATACLLWGIAAVLLRYVLLEHCTTDSRVPVPLLLSGRCFHLFAPSSTKTSRHPPECIAAVSECNTCCRRAQLVRALDERRGSNAGDAGSSSQVPIQAALAFLWNPLSILACVGGSSGCLEAPAVLTAVLGGVLANSAVAGVGVALSAYLAPHHALLLVRPPSCPPPPLAPSSTPEHHC